MENFNIIREKTCNVNGCNHQKWTINKLAWLGELQLKTVLFTIFETVLETKIYSDAYLGFFNTM